MVEGCDSERWWGLLPDDDCMMGGCEKDGKEEGRGSMEDGSGGVSSRAGSEVSSSCSISSRISKMVLCVL